MCGRAYLNMHTCLRACMYACVWVHVCLHPSKKSCQFLFTFIRYAWRHAHQFYGPSWIPWAVVTWLRRDVTRVTCPSTRLTSSTTLTSCAQCVCASKARSLAARRRITWSQNPFRTWRWSVCGQGFVELIRVVTKWKWNILPATGLCDYVVCRRKIHVKWLIVCMVCRSSQTITLYRQ